MKLNTPVKQFVMKQYSAIQLTKTEAIVFILFMCWVVASFFVPIPEITSLAFNLVSCYKLKPKDCLFQPVINR